MYKVGRRLGGVSSLTSNLNQSPAHKDLSFRPSVSFLPGLLHGPSAPWNFHEAMSEAGYWRWSLQRSYLQGFRREHFWCYFPNEFQNYRVRDLVETVFANLVQLIFLVEVFCPEGSTVSGGKVLICGHRAGHVALGTSEASPGSSVASERRGPHPCSPPPPLPQAEEP